MREPVEISDPSGWDTKTFRGLREVLKEDRQVNGLSRFTPGTQAMYIYRFGVWLHDPHRSRLVRTIGKFFYRFLFIYTRNVIGIEIPRTARVGRRVQFVHQHGIVVGPGVSIGDDCRILQNVVIGTRWEYNTPEKYRIQPRVGKNVNIAAGAMVIGNVQIGDGANVGPLTVVTKNVAAGSSVIAQPPRTLRLRF